MEEHREPSFWSIIPDPILSSTKLKANAKLLYAKITSLHSARGYCYASNRYLGEGLGIAPDTVTRLLKDLTETGYLQVEIVRDPENNAILERRIYPTIQMPDLSTPSRINVRYPPGYLSDTLPDKYPSRDIKIENIEENPPVAPQGAGRSGDDNRKSLPKHKPERFEKFWDFYPRHEDRASAVRAWDRLKPSDELIDQMAIALKKQKQLPQWQDKTKIPYACRWLKNQRWLDVCAEPPSVSNLDTPETGGWAEDREVI